MNHLLRHISVFIISVFAATHPLFGPIASAQELAIPDRWKEPLYFVPPIFTDDTITVLFLGDIMMHESQIRHADKNGRYDFSSYFSIIGETIREADIAVANMEFTLAGKPYTGYPCFSAPDEYAHYLADCGFDIFLTANNHIFDKGTEGVERTIGIYGKLEEESGIRFTGTAADEDDMMRNNPLIVRTNGIRLGFVNATYGTNVGLSTHWPKTYRLSSREQMAEVFSRAESAGADIIFALPHWGTEYVLHHSQNQEDTALWLAESGADIIIGAHPHVIQDFQFLDICRDGRPERIPVAYSLGNAVSNMSAANTQLELMATVKIVRHRNGDIYRLPVEFTYLWCSRPGGFNDSYTVIPVEEYIGRKNEWKGSWDYEKMVSTYFYVKEKTGIKDKNTDE